MPRQSYSHTPEDGARCAGQAWAYCRARTEAVPTKAIPAVGSARDEERTEEGETRRTGHAGKMHRGTYTRALEVNRVVAALRRRARVCATLEIYLVVVRVLHWI